MVREQQGVTSVVAQLSRGPGHELDKGDLED